ERSVTTRYPPRLWKKRSAFKINSEIHTGIAALVAIGYNEIFSNKIFSEHTIYLRKCKLVANSNKILDWVKKLNVTNEYSHSEIDGMTYELRNKLIKLFITGLSNEL
ncbi:hypothetical protein L2164_21660, partial [Pectobacterium brasiliense]|uniref:hypothetical protein n=1 Tax=Pectobacterium brasiliense TaxID=180957 RepID=UPI001EE2715B